MNEDNKEFEIKFGEDDQYRHFALEIYKSILTNPNNSALRVDYIKVALDLTDSFLQQVDNRLSGKDKCTHTPAK